MLSKIFISFTILMISLNLLAQKRMPNQSSEETPTGLFFVDSDIYKKALKAYYAKNYQDSISLLDKELSNVNIKDSVNYLLGFNYYRLENFERAEKHFIDVTKNFNIKELSTAYYFLGMSQYNLKKYDEALTSYELALDTSNDSKQDAKIESMIEKTMQMQSLEERNKQKFTTGLGVGYTYHSNAVGSNAFGENYSGHNFSYSAFLTYKAHNDLESSFEPLIYYSDSATLNYKLKQNNVITANDATQIFVSAPYSLSALSFNSNSSFNIAQVYLPSSDKRRSLSTTSYFFKQVFSSVKSETTTNEFKFSVGQDTSHLSYSDDEDNQSAIKYEVVIGSNVKISQQSAKFVNAELGFISNNAEGDNVKYYKYYLNTTYSMPAFKKFYLDTKLTVSQSDYYKSDDNRKDFISSLSTTFTRDILDNLSSSYFISVTNNASNISSNRYTDYAIGFQLLWLNRF